MIKLNVMLVVCLVLNLVISRCAGLPVAPALEKLAEGTTEATTPQFYAQTTASPTTASSMLSPNIVLTLLQRINLIGIMLQTVQHNFNVFIENVIKASQRSITGTRQVNNGTQGDDNGSQGQGHEGNPSVSEVGHNTVGAGEGDTPHKPTNNARPLPGAEPARPEATPKPENGSKPGQAETASTASSNIAGSGISGLGGSGQGGRVRGVRG
ncbi:hypothetical protein HDE_04024 [Halotydeus destructor]|nr:hypothetical protein HDE_04024 [Halotydeus destructor]